MYKTQAETRRKFWEYLKEVNPSLYAHGKRSKRQNEQCTDIRCIFVDWLYNLQRSGKITQKQGESYTL